MAEAVRPRKKHRKKTSSKEKSQKSKGSKKESKESEIPALQEEEQQNIQVQTAEDASSVVKIADDVSDSSKTTSGGGEEDIKKEEKEISVSVKDEELTENDQELERTAVVDVDEQKNDENVGELEESEEGKEEEVFQDAQEDVKHKEEDEEEEITEMIQNLDIKLPPEDDIEGDLKEEQSENVNQPDDLQDLAGRTEGESGLQEETVVVVPPLEDETTNSPASEDTSEQPEIEQDSTVNEEQKIAAQDDDALEELEVLPEDMIRQTEPSAPPAAVLEVDNSETEMVHTPDGDRTMDKMVGDDMQGVTMEESDVNIAGPIVSAPPAEIAIQDTLDNVAEENEGTRTIEGPATEQIQHFNIQPVPLPVVSHRTDQMLEERTIQPEGSKVKVMQPLTTEQLKSYYDNPMIAYQEDYVEHFVQSCRIERHEFYELVLNFFKARNNLQAIQADIEVLNQDYKRQAAGLFTFVDNHIEAKGMCGDGIAVKEMHNYETVEFHKENLILLEKTLKYIRNHVHDTYSLCAYTAQLSRLQIESYIHQLFIRSMGLCQVNNEMPVTANLFASPDQNTRAQIHKLKQCISVLFSFQRRPMTDEDFLTYSRAWLARLIAALLRLATLEDHVFLLNHILRSPAGIDQWAACFIQLIIPSSQSAEGNSNADIGQGWGDPLLDHFGNLLSFFMSPVKYRDDFLAKIRKAITPSSSEVKDNPFNWVLLDEDGEEDEDIDNTLLNENDLVAILQQFPFAQVFKHILHISDTDSTSYDIERVASVDIMKLIAFATFLIGVLHQGVQTFNRSRYRQFVKRIGRLIRHTVQHVSDHWLNYRSWRRDRCHDSDQDIPCIEPQNRQLSLHKLQVEFDEFFFRATQYIMSAPRLGTWQFMTDMPYVSLSQLMMWRLLWYLHQTENSSKETELHPDASPEDYRHSLTELINKIAFEEKLQEMPMSEVIYLLTSFVNMASARPTTEMDFINCIAVEVYELSYVREHTRDFCSKMGRELLSALAATHPFIMSTLVQQITSTIQDVGSMVLHLFRDLPIFLWQPVPDDMALLRVWLLEHGINSIENQLARLVLLNMNWGFQEEGNQLVMNVACHRTTAVLVVEALNKHLVDKPPPGMIASSANKLGLGNAQEQAFHTWSWDMVTKLRLHKQDQPRPVMHAQNEATPDDDFGEAPDVAIDTSLYPVQKAIKSGVPIACYVSVAMTKAGHSLEDFITYGIPHLHIIVQSGSPKMAIPLIAMVVPMFLDEGHPDYLLTNERFMSIVNNILLADHQYSRLSQKFVAQFPGETTSLFTGMVLTQVENSQAPCAQASASEALLEFWLKILTTRTGWHLDPDICYVLDAVIATAFNNANSRRLVMETLLMQYKDMKGDTKAQGLISTVLSFVSYGSNLPSLMEKQSSSNAWLAYAILLAEMQYLDEMNLLRAVSQELAGDPDMTPDAALKRGCTKLRLDFSLPLYRLPIYRLAQQALDTPMDHPLLPVLWQQFFTVYLQRTLSPGNAQRTGSGQRYFQSLTNLSFLKKLKRQLTATADFHHTASKKTKDSTTHNASTPQSEVSSPVSQGTPSEEAGEKGFDAEQVFQGEPEMHQKLVKLYQTYLLWLEEPLLHDPSLYLPSLPDQYDAERLTKIFNGDQELWMEFVDLDKVRHDSSLLVKQWMTMVKPDIGRSSSAAGAVKQPLTSEQQLLDTATSRILDRLNRYEEPKPAPDVVELRAPVPDVPSELLVNNHAMVAFLQDDIVTLVTYANSFSTRENYNVVIDCDYLELLPDLYYNQENQTQLQIPCKSSFNPMHNCGRPAHVTITHREKRTNEINLRKLDENRAEYKQLAIESQAPPPSGVCVAAVHIENAITDLINFSRTASDVELDACRQTGVTLFYHLGQQMDEQSRHYPPTRQFFSSCIEILGQEYIRPFPEQAQALLQEILGNSNLAGLLAPNLAPNLCGDSFVQMYTQVCHAPANGNQDMMFMLLTKFDPTQWLAHSEPSLSLRTQLVNVIGTALCRFGPKVEDTRQLMQFEVFRGHFQTMFCHRFPDHYADVIKLLLEGSEQSQMSADIWCDTLRSLECPLLTFDKTSVEPEKIQQLIQQHLKLSLQQLHETIDWLTAYFTRQRHSDPQCGQFGLYSSWKPYIQPVASFLGYIALNCVVLEAQRVSAADLDAVQAVQKLWTKICGLFSPWLTANDIQSPTNPNVKQLLPPWVEGDGIQGCSMMCIFTEAVGCIQTQFQDMVPPAAKNAMAFLWPYYCQVLAWKSLREDILHVYHQCLINCPWNLYQPDLQAMELMVRIYEEKHPSSLLFLGHIFPHIDWRHLVDVYTHNTMPDTVNKFLSYLLSLLIIFANEEVVLSLEDGGMADLMSDAAQFPWQFLDSSSYDSAAKWQLERCDPRQALGLDKSKPENSISLPRSVLRIFSSSPKLRTNRIAVVQQIELHVSLSLMRSAAGLTSEEALQPAGHGEVKRRSYVDLVVGMMCKCSLLKDVRSEQYISPVHSLLNDVETIATAGGTQVQRIPELQVLLNSILSLLNNCSPIGGAPEAIVKGIMGWLETTASSALSLPCITSACRTVASVKYMAQLVEACVESHFTSAVDLMAEPTRGWGVLNSTLNVPEISHDEFLAECFKQGAYLTLFVYISQRLPECQTLEEESAIYTKLMDWCIQCKPKLENEPKVFLWWWRALELTLRLVDFGTPGWTVSRSLNNLVPAMSALGEDRSSGGLLGAIGLGRQSPLSHQFRLISRCMASFISAQILRNGHIRLKPMEVGSIRDAHTYPQSPTSPDAPRPTSKALQALKILESTVENKNYVALKEHTLLAKSYVLDSEKTLRDAQELLGKLIAALFPDKQYLTIIKAV